MKRNKKTEDELRIVADPQVINGIISFLAILRRSGLYVTKIDGGGGMTFPAPYKVIRMKRICSKFTKDWFKESVGFKQKEIETQGFF